jgi:X-X-X-Leu-X-X-Gly heptad repeat protein
VFTAELTDGAAELTDGAAELTDGAAELTDGEFCLLLVRVWLLRFLVFCSSCVLSAIGVVPF